MYLSFENWEPEVKYNANEFVKTGFSHKSTNSAHHSPAETVSRGGNVL